MSHHLQVAVQGSGWWPQIRPYIGIVVGFALSKVYDAWAARPRGDLKFDGGQIFFLAPGNRCVRSDSTQLDKVMIVVRAHIVNRSGDPLSIGHPGLHVGTVWLPVYDIKGDQVASDTIPPKTSRDYKWVFIARPSDASIKPDTRYDLIIQPDRGKLLKDEVPAGAIIAAVNEGISVDNYLEAKGW